jgi:tetratricopeptide (TPR) repeat protein
MSMNNLASSYADLGRHAEALKLREETLTLRKAKLGLDHPDTLGSMVNLGHSYAALGRPGDAVKLYEEALRIMKAKMPDHRFMFNCMHNLASSYADLGRDAEALKLREETLALRKARLGPDHLDTLRSMTSLATSYAALGRHAEALKLREETLALQKAKLGPDHPDTLRSMHNLANSYDALGRHAEALKLHEQTLELRKAKLGPDHPDTLNSEWGVIASLVALQRPAETLPRIDAVIAAADKMAAAGKRPDPRLVPQMFDFRVRIHREAKDASGCRATAVMWEKLDRRDAASLYNAACYRAVSAAVQAKSKGDESAKHAAADADKAMDWLRRAVAAGYKDRAHMEKDADLDFLRSREDFQELVEGLPKK